MRINDQPALINYNFTEWKCRLYGNLFNVCSSTSQYLLIVRLSY